jgi:signal transduction histidine kinase
MLVQLLDPLLINETHEPDVRDQVSSSGTILNVSANGFSPALKLEFADRGARQFRRSDVSVVKQLSLFFERLWEYEGAFRNGQFDERKRLRRDLHDHVGHKLLTMIHAAPDKDMRALAEDAMTELAASIKNIQLTSTTVAQLGGEIDDCLASILGSTPITFAVNNQAAHSDYPVAGRVRHGLLAILRESINNVLRHANASEMRVDLAIVVIAAQQCLQVTIWDNGKGFNATTIVPGDGLKNIRDRVEELGGAASWRQDVGTWLEISVPLVVDSP